ncbi:trypsin-like peptidase domain-containing protein [Thalassorhabdomicrobium marinisediminis]|uniref:trypsin-like peptidase domain-containing protein n=1 Tax=Thalassorhabdomicrobium marinisediminis TaxID=2170577 RepID=UPI002492BD50|nr:trypsin-like peptidase domain-containing protein [Thalassorhabdomicrobium marinisediminis]
MFRLLTALALCLFAALPATAQQPAYIQVEAQRTLTGAQNAARGYSARGVEDVAGFSIPGGWYAIVLGPYDGNEAARLLRGLRASGAIPRDSYVVDGSQFRTQFWPVGASLSSPDVPDDTDEGQQEADDAPETPVAAPDPTEIPDETLSQARASERALDRDEKRALQVALQWAGFYDGAIDGLFGGGTRRSMTAWQEANNHDATGVLTTGQRAELFAAYNAVLEGMDLQLVRDDAAGIEIQMPLGVVEFTEYEPPFARYDASGELDAQVLLISQPGDQTRMSGLYEILQTLAVVPPEGERNRTNRGFTIEGVNDRIHSYTSVVLDGGEIKGFMLIWPAGDDERRRRVLNEMQASFRPIDGVLDPATAQPDEDQSVDLISGLEVRKPLRDRSGFYIGSGGEVLTSAEAIAGCGSITLDMEHGATAAHVDEALGIAVLRPERPLAPPAVAEFQTSVPRLNADVAVAGFPYGGVLTTPALTFGTLADIRGLNGEEGVKRLSITTQDGDTGGPVFDGGGAVLGMLKPRSQQNGQVLPADVAFSVDADEIIGSVRGAGLDVRTTDTLAYMPPETLTLLAADMAVLVSCWED